MNRTGATPPPRTALAAAGMAILSLASPVASPVASGAEITLHALQLPERTTVVVTFAPTVRAPAGAVLDGDLRNEGTRTRVALSWKKMKPALLFGGNVSSYVAWAVTKDAAAESLGELFVSGARGEMVFSTSRHDFGLMVTAEPHPGVLRPSDVVVFTGEAPKSGKVPSEPIALSRFTVDAKPATPSIASLEWTSSEPVEIVQARTILATAEREQTGAQDQRLVRDARAALAAAEAPPQGGSRNAALDEARRATRLASEALHETALRRAAEEQASLQNERSERETARKAAAVDEADRLRQAEAALAEIEELRQKTALDLERTHLAAAALAASSAQLEEEKGRLLEEREALRRERAAGATGLADALEKVAPTLESARGFVVTLPGSAFDAHKPLPRPAARVTISKLAGILLMLPEKNVRIEGYTDSTGNAASNRKLSEDRARSIADLLREEGIRGERIVFAGYGAESPVAPNTNAEGRALNRRVEIIVGEGRIPEPLRETEAPTPQP